MQSEFLGAFRIGNCPGPSFLGSTIDTWRGKLIALGGKPEERENIPGMDGQRARIPVVLVQFDQFQLRKPRRAAGKGGVGADARADMDEGVFVGREFDADFRPFPGPVQQGRVSAEAARHDKGAGGFRVFRRFDVPRLDVAA